VGFLSIHVRAADVIESHYKNYEKEKLDSGEIKKIAGFYC
jgi:hypothetical protein